MVLDNSLFNKTSPEGFFRSKSNSPLIHHNNSSK